MNPKMTLKDAADFLGVSARKLFKRIIAAELPYNRESGAIYFDYPTARHVFQLAVKPQVISLQIVKGGTGKTSLACAIATRANLYGLRVLCIDLDQQGNMTNYFGVDAESLPVMVDILAEGYSYDQAITRVYPGMDLLASRIENALLDEVLKLKRFDLSKVYREPLEKLKTKYDLIIIDCPPNLGQSVAAVTLAVDKVIAPVVPENFALSGLKATKSAIAELQEKYKVNINLGVVVNKYDPRAVLSLEARQLLSGNLAQVHVAAEFPNAIARGQSIFDSPKSSQAKRDIDKLMCELLGIDKDATRVGQVEHRISNFEESWA